MEEIKSNNSNATMFFSFGSHENQSLYSRDDALSENASAKIKSKALKSSWTRVFEVSQIQGPPDQVHSLDDDMLEFENLFNETEEDAI